MTIVRTVHRFLRRGKREQCGQLAGVEALAAAEHLRGWPPAEAEVVVFLIVQAPRLVDARPGDEQAHRHDHLVLQVPCLPVPERRPAPPCGRPDLTARGHDPGLLAKFPDRGVEVDLARVYAVAGQFPPGPQFRGWPGSRVLKSSSLPWASSTTIGGSA